MENINNYDINARNSIRGLKTIKMALAMLDIYQCPIIPESDTSMFVMNEDIKMHLEIHRIDGEIIFKIEELEIENKNFGLGSMILFIITKAMELARIKIGVWTVPGNERAENWYKKLGFKEIRVLESNNHKWLEKEPNMKHDYYVGKINKDILLLLLDAITEIYRSLLSEELRDLKDKIAQSEEKLNDR